jgi:hypothetical protein
MPKASMSYCSFWFYGPVGRGVKKEPEMQLKIQGTVA